MFKLLIPAALLAASLSAPVSAQSATSQRVAYADLDLASPAGVRTLDARLKSAIAKACGDDFALHASAEAAEIRRCKAVLKSQVAASRAAVLATARPEAGAIAAR